MSGKKQEIGLVLQGGGALGAYEVGAIKKIYEQGYLPTMITGTSIGAINAAVLAAPKNGDPIADLEELWNYLRNDPPFFVPKRFHQLASSMGHPHFYQMRADIMNMDFWPSLYDVGPALETMRKFIDFDYLNSSKAPTIAVTATNVETGDIEQFTNRNHQLTPEHLMASGSLPPSFPPIMVDGSYYWDGGIYDNTPVQSLLNILKEHQIETMPIFIIELFSNRGTVPQSINDALDRMTELVYEDKFWKSFDGHENANGFAHMLWELDKALPKNSPVRKDPHFQSFMHMRAVSHIFTIPAEHTTLSGIVDFSSESIDERIKKGYGAAVKFFENKNNTKLVQQVFEGLSK